MKGGLTFYRGSGKEARNYIEADHHKVGRADEYYLAEGHGIAEMVRIRNGEVTATVSMDGDTYEKWVEGQDVVTGLDKGHVIKGGDQRRALRFCEININAPKSLSLVAALHPDISLALDAAELAAAQQLNSILAKNVTTRIGPQGAQRQVHVDEIEVVSVAHQTSRAGDPHRHIHHQINARVLVDGTYRGLDSKAMLRMTRMLNGVGERAIIAHPELRQALAEHGYTLTRQGEVTQLAQYVPAMSKRATQVERNIARYEREWRQLNPGEEPGGALRQDWKRAAWNDGRQAKNKRRLAMPGELVDQEWRTELCGLGVDVDGLQAAEAVAIQGPTPGEIDRDAVAARALAVLGTGANGRSTWNVYDIRGAVEETLAKQLVHGDAAALNAIAEDITEQVRAECLTTDPTRRAMIPDHVRHLTSPAVIELENDIKARLAGRSIEGHQLYLGGVPEGLDAGQVHAVRVIAGTGQLVQIEGAAGVGKTKMLAAAQQVLTGQGKTLKVFAPSKKAAMVAAAEIGASEANTLHGLVYAHGYRWDDDGVWTRQRPNDVPAAAVLAAGDVVVVDEAGMADQEAVRALLTVLDEADGTVPVVFVGDRQQLAPVGRGGSMDFVHAWAPAYVEMNAVHRFKVRGDGVLLDSADEQYAELSLRMRTGQEPERVFDELAASGRVVVHATEAEAVEHLAAQATDNPTVTQTIAVSTNAAAEAINLEARNRLVAAGVVDDEVTVDAADGIRLGRGDRVQTRSNERDLGVMNRECWEVTNVRTDGTVRLQNEQDRRFTEVDAEYCRANVQHNYAGTVHSVQGVTVDRAAMLLTGGGDGAGAYVGMTRGRFSNVAHIVAPSLADAREIWVETAGRDNQDAGLAQAAQSATVEASAYALDRPYADVPDRDLAARVAGWRQAQENAEKWRAEAERTREKRPFTAKAEWETAKDRDRAWQAASRAGADRSVSETAQQIRHAQQQLAAARGPFKGGQRKALSEQIAALRAAHAERVAAQEAAARPEPGAGADYRGDPVVEARAAARLARAAGDDAKAVTRDEQQAEQWAVKAEQVREQLPAAEAELELRAEHPELSVEVPAEQLAREAQERAARTAAHALQRAQQETQVAAAVDHGMSM
jgi:conjugative relaxase-like TrwC/TraI family protein